MVPGMKRHTASESERTVTSCRDRDSRDSVKDGCSVNGPAALIDCIDTIDIQEDDCLPFFGGSLVVSGTGGYATVVKAHMKSDRMMREMAVKILSNSHSLSTELFAFENEKRFFEEMEEYRGYEDMQWIPKYYGSGMLKEVASSSDDGGLPWIGMELLYSLDDEYHAEWVTTSDSLSSYICDMIDALRSLHNKGFVHRDVKPENFMLRETREGYQIVLIDFGLIEKIEICSAISQWQFHGTVPFASLRQLKGQPVGPADDLESLAYSVLQMQGKYLPWLFNHYDGLYSESTEKFKTSLETQLAHREYMLQEMISSGEMSSSLQKWIQYCRSIKPHQEPNYDYLKSLIQSKKRRRNSNHRLHRREAHPGKGGCPEE